MDKDIKESFNSNTKNPFKINYDQNLISIKENNRHSNENIYFEQKKEKLSRDFDEAIINNNYKFEEMKDIK